MRLKKVFEAPPEELKQLAQKLREIRVCRAFGVQTREDVVLRELEKQKCRQYRQTAYTEVLDVACVRCGEPNKVESHVDKSRPLVVHRQDCAGCGKLMEVWVHEYQ